MKILITGGTGFLGSALTKFWLHQGHELCLLLRPQSNKNRIESFLRDVQIEFIDRAEDGAVVVNRFAPDVIVHTACSYGRAKESLLEVADANMRLGLALIQAVLAQKDKKNVFINTGTVLNPNIGLYALTKTQFSTLGSHLAQHNPDRLHFINVRLQQMYGPGDDRSKFTTHVIEACRANEEKLALTSGEQYRDFIHIEDAVSAYDTILRRHSTFAAADEIDVGSGESVTMRQFVELVKQLTAAETRLDFGAVPYRPNEDMMCTADTSRLKGLGWNNKFNLHDGVKQTLQAGK